jgi:flavodoxin
MKVGIIIHSQTGHTLSVAEALSAKLQASGHYAKIERVTAAADDETNPSLVKLTSAPDTAGYDMLIFGAPVRGFHLSPVMEAYINKQPTLKGKPVSCFITESFPKPWMGGNQAMARFNEICRSKGSAPLKTAIINWMNPKKRDLLIEAAIAVLSDIK